VRLLLDTHALLWWITDSVQLSAAARQSIAAGSNQLFWSAASSWEVGIKFALSRLALPAPPEDYLPYHLELNAIERLPISERHAYRAAALPQHHADPFDRILVAQAQVEGLRLVTGDPLLSRYEIKIVW